MSSNKLRTALHREKEWGIFLFLEKEVRISTGRKPYPPPNYSLISALSERAHQKPTNQKSKQIKLDELTHK